MTDFEKDTLCKLLIMFERELKEDHIKQGQYSFTSKYTKSDAIEAANNIRFIVGEMLA